MNTQIIVAVIGSGLLTTVINRIFNYLDKRAELKSGVTHGVRLILKDRLRFLCTRYIEQGWIYEGIVRGMEGIGRFVLGLEANIDVLEGAELKAYLRCHAEELLKKV